MTRKEFWKQAKQIIRDYAEEYDRTRAQSHNAALKTLKPGQPVPASDKILGESYRRTFTATSDEYRKKLHGLVESARTDLMRAKTESPSPEAINVLTVLGIRSSVSPEDITDAFQRYGENYLFAKTLADIAHDKDIHVSLPAHEADSAGELIDMVAHTADEMTINMAEQGRFAPGRLAFIETMTDASVSDD